MVQQDDPERIFMHKPGSRSFSERNLIVAILVAWGTLPFGFQLLVWLLGDQNGQSVLTRFTFFNLPFHFWFTGQFLPLWFIILCVLFNLYTDRVSARHATRRFRSHE